MDPKNAPPVEEYDNLDVPAAPPAPPVQTPAPATPVTPYVVPQQEVPAPITGASPSQPVIAEVPPVYEDTGKKRVLLAGGFLLLFLLIIGGVAAFILSRGQENPETSQNQPVATTSATLSNEPRLLPQVAFDTWVPEYSASGSASTSYLLTVKQPSEDIGHDFAQKMGFGDIEFDETSLTGYVETASESALFMYEVNTGSLLYLAEMGKQLTGEPSNDTVINFLQRFGVYDSSMNVFATYQKTSTPGVTYYEIHRNWEFVGLPILQTLGLTTLPESEPLNELVQENKPEVADEDIVRTSDNTDGYARAEDFNTLTVGVDQESGRVVYLYGAMRQIESVQRDISLISADEAFELLQAGEYAELIPVPAGEGNPNMNDVFPGEVTRGAEAVVTDAIPAYRESPMTEQQDAIRPYWVFRGYSELESGYRIRFIATVPAETESIDEQPIDASGESSSLEQNTLRSRFLGKLIGAVHAEGTLAQQQQGAIPTNEPLPTSPPVEELEPLDPTPEASETPDQTVEEVETIQEPENPLNPREPASYSAQCPVQVTDLLDRTIINGFEFGMLPSKGMPNETSEWYYVPGKNAPDTVAFAKSIFETATTLPGEGGTREQKWAVKEILDAIQQAKRSENPIICPARVTGISPTLFYYGTQTITVLPLTQLTYSDPPIGEYWTVTATNPGLLINTIPRPYLYYEYNPNAVLFSRPDEGWVLSRVLLPTLVSQLQLQFQLSDQEAGRMLYEIMDTAKGIESVYLRVSIIPQQFVDEQIPLLVQASSDVSVQRLFFHVEAATLSDSFTVPRLSPVPRTPEMILEIGGYTNKQ